MDLLVVFEVLRQIAARMVRKHVEMQRTDFSDVLVRRIAAGQIAGQRFQRTEHDEHFLHLFRLQRRHHRAAVGQQLDQAFGSEELDRLAQRGARRAQPLGQHAFIQFGFRRQLALHNEVAQLVNHRFMQQPTVDQ